jgi:hypothetical protein
MIKKIVSLALSYIVGDTLNHKIIHSLENNLHMTPLAVATAMPTG